VHRASATFTYLRILNLCVCVCVCLFEEAITVYLNLCVIYMCVFVCVLKGVSANCTAPTLITLLEDNNLETKPSFCQ
jgi:hypothetical protein